MNSELATSNGRGPWAPAPARSSERDRAQRWAAFASSSEDAFITEGVDGTIDSWNPGAQRLFGYPSDEVLGQPATLLSPLERGDEIRHALRRIQEGESIVRFESVLRKKNGSLVEVSLTISAIADPNGRTVGFSRIVRDLTDLTARRRAEDEIRRLNVELDRRVQERTARLEATMKELEAFSYSVSHDLRAPLRGIDGLCRILMEGHSATLDADGQRLLNTIRNETRRMGQLIDDLLAFSRASRQELDAAEINMTDLAENAAQNLAEARPDGVPPIRINPLPAACGDRSMVRQVFANLLDNAIKFSSRQPLPVIEVSGRSEGGWNVYCVKDNGAGFDQRYAGKLFAVFQRLHRQEEFEGTGVGLALVQRIIHRHGGKVWAEGKVGGGASFYFTLR